MVNKINNFKLFGLNYFKLLFIFHIIVVFGLLFMLVLKEIICPIQCLTFRIIRSIMIIYHIYRLITNGLHDKIWNYLHISICSTINIFSNL